MPGSNIPSFPLAGAILEGFSMPLLLFNDHDAIDRKMKLEQELPHQKRAASPNKQIIMRDVAEICKSDRKQGVQATRRPL
jgi:hypothetical protein